MTDIQSVYPSIMENLALYQGWRRDIHRHPELGFEESRTAGIVEEKLNGFGGIESHCGIGSTGVVGVLRKGNGLRSIGLRADLDALPMHEENTFMHRSVYPGKFHGCGHDGHTVMLLAAAQYLAKFGRFDGTVYFIFQPAEEGMGGGHAMIQDGLFDRFPMNSVYGLHNAPTIAAGDFAVLPGPMLAAFEKFDITITGRGSHGAMPHQGIDPILVSAQLIQALQGIVSRSIDPVYSGVISVTRIHAGDTYNVIPEQVNLSGAIRYLESEIGETIRQRMVELVTSVSAASGAVGELRFHELGYPPLVNDSKCTEKAKSIAAQLVGGNRVVDDIDPIMGSDDFAYMLQEKPGCYVLIGNGIGSKGGCHVHHPLYDFNDEIIPYGAAFWSKLVESEMPSL